MKSWLVDFSKEFNVHLTDTTLFRLSAESFEKLLYSFNSLYQFLEFSFSASECFSHYKLRYTIDISRINSEDIIEIIRAGVNRLENIPEKTRLNPVFFRPNSIFDKVGRNLLYAIGAEHETNGSISVFKTYWRFKSPLEELKVLLHGKKSEMFKKTRNEIQDFWPNWIIARLTGIDYLPQGEYKFKLYLPQTSCVEPLSLVTFCEFLLCLGWKIDLDSFTKLSYFILKHRMVVEPSAYIVGFSIGNISSIKLEIAARAYFMNSRETLKAVSALAKSLGLDPTPVHLGFSALEKHNPFFRQPVIEVICLDFYSDGRNRITIYCRF